MTWDYRVMRFADPVREEWLEIHGVYYREDGAPAMYTERAVGVCSDGGVDGLRATLRLMERALDEPVLTPDDFPADAF